MNKKTVLLACALTLIVGVAGVAGERALITFRSVTKSLVIVFPRKAQKARNGDREWRFVVASISRRLVRLGLGLGLSTGRIALNVDGDFMCPASR